LLRYNGFLRRAAAADPRRRNPTQEGRRLLRVDIQWQIASAWALYAEGKSEEALKVMSAAADSEED
jgi:hypothetical protein